MTEIGPVDRYNRHAEDWRFHHKLIWEIPSVSAAIFGAIIIVSYAYLELLLQSALLGVGALLIFILALAVRKHRCGADLRTNFLEDLGRDCQVFPIRSTERHARDATVTKLIARPMLNIFFPELSHFEQPLSGEVCARGRLYRLASP